MTKIEDINYDRIRGQIIYKGECIDSDDPLRLGRIRAKLRTENKQDREIANQALFQHPPLPTDQVS